MYCGLIIRHLHSLMEHFHTVRSEFKEQITISDQDTIGSFHLLTFADFEMGQNGASGKL